MWCILRNNKVDMVKNLSKQDVCSRVWFLSRLINVVGRVVGQHATVHSVNHVNMVHIISVRVAVVRIASVHFVVVHIVVEFPNSRLSFFTTRK
jgi:hypothetical protein